MAPYDTIVIGLGAAGCQAASILAQAGKQVLGLEAQGRIGGRVNTVNFGEGVVELGAEWIHGTVGNSVYDIATASKVSLVNEYMKSKIFRSDGSTMDQDLAMEVINQLLESEEVPAEPGCLGDSVMQNVQNYFATTYPELLKDEEFMTEFYQVLELIINNLNASNSWNDVTDQSSQSFLEGCGHVSWEKLGYRTLFDILLNKHNGGPGYPNLEIRLNTEVTHVQWPQDPRDQVRVTTKDGTTYSAHNAIITLSLGVMKECCHNLFTPKLPDVKIKAIENISIGVMDKVIMCFDKVWWKGEQMFNLFLWKAEDKRKVGREDYWTTRILGVSNPKGSRNSITFWTSGEVAKIVEILPEDVVKAKLMILLRKFLGSYVENIPEPTGIVRSTWHSNPYTRGSYTYENLETPKHPTARSDLGSPLLDSAGTPRVMFAGEATNADNYATVNGAVDSGIREAKRILDFEKKNFVKSKY